MYIARALWSIFISSTTPPLSHLGEVHTRPSLALTLGKLNWIAQKEPEIALIQNIERVLPKETNMKIEQHILYVSCYLDDCEKLGQSIKRYLRSHSGTMAAGYSDRATMTRWLWDGQAIHAIARGHRGIIAKCTIDMSIKCLFSIKAHSSLNLDRHQTKDIREHSTSVESDIRLLLYINFRKFSNFLQKVSKSIWDMEMEMFAHFSSLSYSCFVFVSRCGGGVWWEGVRMLVNSLPPRWFLIKAAD